MQQLVPLLLLPLLYVALILPQRRRQKAQQALISAVGVGASVMTTSGMYGTVTSVDDDVVGLEIADGVVIRIAKRAIARSIDSPVTDQADHDATLSDPTSTDQPTPNSLRSSIRPNSSQPEVGA